MEQGRFRIVEVDPAQAYSLEALGTKEKFWVKHPVLGLSLVKYPRTGSGEDWSEVIAAAIAGLLGLPHASYEFADVAGRAATISPNFVRDGRRLVHGNELLGILISDYDPGVSKFRVSKHTTDLVLEILSVESIKVPADWVPDAGIGTAQEVFLGYLMLDATIGNTDRHHENWGLVGGGDIGITLAPTFDHASSMGCHEKDSKKKQRLFGTDPRFDVETYCAKARSAFFEHESDAKALWTIDAFHVARARCPGAARFWLQRLDRLTDEFIDRLMVRVPKSRMTETSKAFAAAVLKVNRKRLLELLEESA